MSLGADKCWSPKQDLEVIRDMFDFSEDSNDARQLTVILSSKTANKVISREENGKISKRPGNLIGKAWATNIFLPTASDLEKLLKIVADNSRLVLMQGYFDGAKQGEIFRVMSQKLIANKLKLDRFDDQESRAKIARWHDLDSGRAIPRLKECVTPSAWQPLDRDVHESMPAELQKVASEDEFFFAAMEKIHPGFMAAAKVTIASASGRVVFEKPLEARGRRTWVQISRPDQLQSWGVALLASAQAAGYVYQKKSKAGHFLERAIFDPTTFSEERLVFDGKPVAIDRSHETNPKVLDPEVVVVPGNVLDISQCVEFDEVVLKQYEASTKRKIVRSADGLEVHDSESLRADTRILTATHSEMTLMEFWRSEHKKIRCQATFRESSSWNGFLGKHDDGTPFLFDNGTRVKYLLTVEELMLHRAEILSAKLKSMEKGLVQQVWATKVVHWTDAEQRIVLEAIAKVHSIGISVLVKQLKEAQKNLDASKRETERNRKNRDRVRRGLIEIQWDESRLLSIIQTIQGCVLEYADGERTPVFSKGNLLVTVCRDVPKTVRQVKQYCENTLPDMMLIEPFSIDSLRMRIMESVELVDTEGNGLAPNDLLVRAFRDASVAKASPLVGLVEHPVISPDGKLIAGSGYDQCTGLYLSVAEELTPNLDFQIDTFHAEESLLWLRSHYLRDYPFGDQLDADAAIAMNLTLLERVFVAGSTGFPGFSSNAPTQGSGKTTIFSQASEAIYGRPVAASSFPQNTEEMAKHLTALLLEGQPLVLFDNLPEGRAFFSDELAKAMTSDTYKNRLLGTNRTVSAAANIVFGFTGNNITPAEDFATRVLQIELCPETENPDRRAFTRVNIIDWTAENRPQVLRHLCILVAGFLRSGTQLDVCPTRFTQWDRLVRFPIIWAGGLDVAQAFNRNKADDPYRTDRANFFADWYKIFGELWLMPGEIAERINNEFDEKVSSLRKYFTDHLQGGEVTGRALTGHLKKIKNKVIDGMRLEHKSMSEEEMRNHRTMPWRVVKVARS